MSKKGKANHERNCQSISFISETDYLHLKASYKDESACLWKQPKWNKIPFYGVKLSVKLLAGINISHSLSEKIT